VFIRRETGEVLPRFHVGSAQRRAAMKVVAALIKDGQVIDTYPIDVPTRDDLAAMAKKAFAHFHDRYPHLTHGRRCDNLRSETMTGLTKVAIGSEVHPTLHSHGRRDHPARRRLAA
jgi:hypothetical protein